LHLQQPGLRAALPLSEQRQRLLIAIDDPFQVGIALQIQYILALIVYLVEVLVTLLYQQVGRLDVVEIVATIVE
jgi:hypothetical protein